MYFVRRLLKAIGAAENRTDAMMKQLPLSLEEPPVYLEQIGANFSQNDRLFLCQGWGDIVIAFEPP